MAILPSDTNTELLLVSFLKQQIASTDSTPSFGPKTPGLREGSTAWITAVAHLAMTFTPRNGLTSSKAISCRLPRPTAFPAVSLTRPVAIQISPPSCQGCHINSSLSPVVVTGGCGFTGFHLVTGILELEPDCTIHVIDINTNRNRVAGAHPKTVFHLACPDSTVKQPAVFKRVNVVGARNLVAAARKTVHVFVNTTISSVVHDNKSDLRDADETLPVLKYPTQKRVYTLTKAEADAHIKAANREGGDNASMLTVELRPGTIFGPRDTICMGKIIANARAGKANIQMGPGNNYYDFVYVSNLVDANILAAKALLNAYGKPTPPNDMRVDGEAFNVTNDEHVEFWEFQRAIAALIKRVLGYKPKVGIDEGLAVAGKWFMEEANKAK
ncbi:hypothetical protein B0T17DRAFT_602170 [Bombardia bombarda]|uniref:3-beta hydroxysteroid dehydrogenase/isomerase domain-containing protein n=1 Tax=Bombardia bombarda TaxID=252184 RepID=A0AA40BVB4_9PEZI|nr:hypothetical protein B0T17DRAFT_602170 [Bombardia bombarda]